MKNQLITTLREKRNEVIPPKLEFGCEMLWKKEKMKMGSIFTFLDMKHNGILKVKFSNGVIGERAAFIGDCILLGKPVSLQDLLVMMKYKKIQIQSNGVLQEVSGDTYEQEKRIIHCNLDLTLSIEEQSEKTLSAIMEILK